MGLQAILGGNLGDNVGAQTHASTDWRPELRPLLLDNLAVAIPCDVFISDVKRGVRCPAENIADKCDTRARALSEEQRHQRVGPSATLSWQPRLACVPTSFHVVLCEQTGGNDGM